MPSVFVMRGPSISLGIVDNFNRADGTSLLANRSDGGLWTVGSISDMQISSNRLIRTGGGIAVAKDQMLYADYGYSGTVSASFDWAQTTRTSGWLAWIAADLGLTAGYEIQFDPNSADIFVKRNGGSGAILATANTGNFFSDGIARTVTIAYVYSTGALTVAIAGTTYLTYTVPVLSAATGLGLLHARSYATAGTYIDNVNVTGT